jgi:hypothetical protein
MSTEREHMRPHHQGGATATPFAVPEPAALIGTMGSAIGLRSAIKAKRRVHGNVTPNPFAGVLGIGDPPSTRRIAPLRTGIQFLNRLKGADAEERMGLEKWAGVKGQHYG